MSIRRSCGFDAAKLPAAPEVMNCSVPNGRVISAAAAVGVEIRRDAVEPARTVEHGRAQPHGMRHGADQRRIAGKPVSVDIGEGGGAGGCVDGHDGLLFSLLCSKVAADGEVKAKHATETRIRRQEGPQARKLPIST